MGLHRPIWGLQGPLHPHVWGHVWAHTEALTEALMGLHESLHASGRAYLLDLVELGEYAI